MALYDISPFKKSGYMCAGAHIPLLSNFSNDSFCLGKMPTSPSPLLPGKPVEGGGGNRPGILKMPAPDIPEYVQKQLGPGQESQISSQYQYTSLEFFQVYIWIRYNQVHIPNPINHRHLDPLQTNQPFPNSLTSSLLGFFFLHYAHQFSDTHLGQKQQLLDTSSITYRARCYQILIPVHKTNCASHQLSDL